MMYVLNKITEYRGLEADDFKVEAITCSNNLDELNEIRTALEEQDKHLWGDIEVEYSIMDLKSIEEVRREVRLDFEQVLRDIISIGIDKEVEKLISKNLDMSHLPIDVEIEEDSQIVLTFEEGNKKRLIIEDIK